MHEWKREWIIGVQAIWGYSGRRQGHPRQTDSVREQKGRWQWCKEICWADDERKVERGYETTVRGKWQSFTSWQWSRWRCNSERHSSRQTSRCTTVEVLGCCTTLSGYIPSSHIRRDHRNLNPECSSAHRWRRRPIRCGCLCMETPFRILPEGISRPLQSTGQDHTKTQQFVCWSRAPEAPCGMQAHSPW